MKTILYYSAWFLIGATIGWFLLGSHSHSEPKKNYAVNKNDFFALTEHNLLCRYSPVLSKEINSPVFVCLGEK